jgi:hypothetical protein
MNDHDPESIAAIFEEWQRQEAERPAIDARKAALRADAIARDELAAEGLPKLSIVTTGDVWLARPHPDLPWRIEGIFPAGGNVILAAQFKAGKTTLRDNASSTGRCNTGLSFGA